MVIDGKQFTLTDVGGITEKGDLALDPSQTPKHIDIETIGTDGNRRKNLGIYKLEGSTLTICLARPKADRPSKFPADDERDGAWLMVYRRQIENRPPLTPLEVIQQSTSLLEAAPICVRFRIGVVDTIPVTLPDKTPFNEIRLHPNTDFDPSLRASFYVTLSAEMEETLKRIGIADLQKHFRGKDIEVTGRLSQGAIGLYGSPNIYFYHIEIRDLDQIRSVANCLVRENTSLPGGNDIK